MYIPDKSNLATLKYISKYLKEFKSLCQFLKDREPYDILKRL
jgi:hypothetical protein